NNRILGLMRRQYSVEEFEKLVSDLRKDIKDLSVSTDIIAGFPTETKQEFLDSVRLIEKIKFDTVNISKFAVRPETGAERLPQLSEKEKSRRSHILTRVCRNVFLQKNKELVGRKEKILVVEKAKINGFAGRTNSYKNVFVPNAELNEFAYATIEEAFPNFLKGTIC
ncbi:MAG: TRAM domain-containing protein, partial [archaeon]